MTTTSTGLSKLAQIALTVRQPDRAVAFYRDALGVPLLFQAPPNLAFFNLDGVRLMIAPVEGEFEPPGSILYFAVDDIRTKHQELVARGVRFKTEPHMVAKLPDREVWLADFEDGEGNTLALMAEPRI
jgi:predicted enzyme related to lactoylglutathione lyase